MTLSKLVKVSKLSKLPLMQLVLYAVLIVAVTTLIYSAAKPCMLSKAKFDTFAEGDSKSILAENVIFNTEDNYTKSVIPGQLLVQGDNNLIGGSFLPHDNGNVYIRPQEDNKRVFLGDKMTKGTELGSSDKNEYNRVGLHSWMPYTDGNTYIRPGKDGKDVMVGDYLTNGTRVGPNAKFNQVGPHSWLPYTDGNSYIRPGQDNKAVVIGDMWTNEIWLGEDSNKRKTNTHVRGRLLFDHFWHNSDPYYLEKVHNNGGNKSSLRMTINDDQDEAFDIFGNSCRSAGGCGGPGVAAHRFRADGKAIHRNEICIGNMNDGDSMDNSGLVCLNKQDIINIKNKV